MQGKGLIKIFFVLLVLVSVLQLFYMMPTRKVEAEAAEYAKAYAEQNPGEDQYVTEKNARIAYLDSISSEEILRVPLLGSYTYEDLKQRQLALGLDLKGGMSTVLQVDLKELLIQLSNNSKDVAFRTALDNAEKAQENSQSEFISLFFQEYQKMPDRKKLANIFMRDPSLREQINTQTSDGEVIRILREKADETVNLTFNRLKQRIDKLGVTQPNVSLDAARDLILVEMPGIDNPERARNFLQASAALEFWETYRNSDPGIMQAFIEADARLKALVDGDTLNMEEPAIAYDTIWTPEIDSLGNLTGDSTFQLVENQLDPFESQGPLLSVLTLNNGAGGFLYPQTAMGVTQKNKRNNVLDMLSKPEVRGLFPLDSKFLWSQKPYVDIDGEETDDYLLYLIKKQPGSDKPPLEGDVIIDASQAPNPVTGEIAVNLRMDSKGTKKWAEMTTKAANDGNREIAIVLDDEIVSAPGVRGPITGGSSEITGGFTVQEASDLASILEVGKLPAKTKSIQESTVGPSLGKQNINSSLEALLFGFVLLLAFMIFYYAGAGIVSIIALLLNLFFIFGALASFGTVLTLPGIAGIVLTIGMAVDANVIIFERIKEELRAGKSLLASISDGFKHSYSAIIDANVTTILVAIILAYFGLGPIKGFAVVLIIGVLSSLFTAVLVGRMMIDWWTGGGRSIAFWTPPTSTFLANLKIDWIGKRKIAYVVSSVIIIAGVISMFTKKFDLGVDFRGGYSYNVEFIQGAEVDVPTLRSGLAEFLESTPVVKAVDTENTFNIVSSYLINDQADDAAERVVAKLHEGITSITGENVSLEAFKTRDAQGVSHVTSSSKVGPTIADDIKQSSFYAGTFALLLIFLYIFIRFNKWQYSLGAVAALFHDSLIVLGLFSIFWGILPFSMEIDQAFIAAILTVIGYSINDTVVVFDRIREYLGIYTQKSTDEVLNLAINSTFSRTLITSLTTLIVIGFLFVFGGGSIKGFAFALLIGVIVGTYSSIFVATPIVRDLSDELKPTKVKARKSFSKAAQAAR